MAEFVVDSESAKEYEAIEEDNSPIPVPIPEEEEENENRYEAEAADLDGSATISNTAGASNGQMVGWLGNGEGEMIFRNIYAPESAFYTLEFSYVLGSEYRFANLEIRGEDGDIVDETRVDFYSTGGWSILDKTYVVAFLEEGMNTIRFYNEEDYAPDTDYLELHRGSPTGIYAIDADLSDWPEGASTLASENFVLSATHDKSFLYIAVEGIDLDNPWTIHIASDYYLSSEGFYSTSTGQSQILAEVNSTKYLLAENQTAIELMLHRDLIPGIETAEIAVENASRESAGLEHVIVPSGELPEIDVPSPSWKIWEDVPIISHDDYQNVWVTDDENYLYFAIEELLDLGEEQDWSVSLNSDLDHNTGYLESWLWFWLSTGADYLLKGDGIYRLDTNGQRSLLASNDASIYTVIENGALTEIRLSKEALADTLVKSICFGVKQFETAEDTTPVSYTKDGENMLFYDLQYVEDYVFPGTMTDWSHVLPILEERDLQIVGKDDSDYVYFGFEYTTENINGWQLLMDTDIRAVTGMQNAWPFSPGGMDYIVEANIESASLMSKQSTDGNWDFGNGTTEGLEWTFNTEEKRV